MYYHRLFRPEIETRLFNQAFQATLARRLFKPYVEFNRPDALLPMDVGFLELMVRIDDLHVGGETIHPLLFDAMVRALVPYTQDVPVSQRIDAKLSGRYYTDRTYYEATMHDIRSDEAFYALFPDIDPDSYALSMFYAAFRKHTIVESTQPLDGALYHIGLRSHMTRLIERALFQTHGVKRDECDDIVSVMLDAHTADGADFYERINESEDADPLVPVHKHWALAGQLDDETLAAIKAGIKPYTEHPHIVGLSGDDAHDLLFGSHPRESYISELVLDLLDIEPHPELYIDPHASNA